MFKYTLLAPQGNRDATLSHSDDIGHSTLCRVKGAYLRCIMIKRIVLYQGRELYWEKGGRNVVEC